MVVLQCRASQVAITENPLAPSLALDHSPDFQLEIRLAPPAWLWRKPLRALMQGRRLFRSFAPGHVTAIRHESVFLNGDIQLDQVALLQCAAAGIPCPLHREVMQFTQGIRKPMPERTVSVLPHHAAPTSSTPRVMAGRTLVSHRPSIRQTTAPAARIPANSSGPLMDMDHLRHIYFHASTSKS